MSAPTHEISISGLSYSINGQGLLDNVDLHIQSGQRIAIVGANGAGKTTLLKAILGIITPDTGEIIIQGNPITTLSRRAIAQKIAYVPQNLDSDIPFSVHDFILMSRYSHKSMHLIPRDPQGEEIARSMLHRTGISHLTERKMKTLSGGERQKVSIAAALSQEASILLLDEPAAHLDPTQQESVQNLLGEISQIEQLTIITVTHDLNWAAMHFDRIIGFKKGKILSDAAPNQFMTTENLEAIFDTRWEIIPHPHTSCPMVLPSSHHTLSSHD